MAAKSVRRLSRPLKSIAAWEQRVAALEEEVQETRGLNRRLAEVCDVMMELLVPVAQRDEAEIAAIMERYRADVSEPIGWRHKV